MKIDAVALDNRKKLFVVEVSGRSYVFPYAKTDPQPNASDRIAEVLVDPELGREGFTYVGGFHALRSRLYAVLAFNEGQEAQDGSARVHRW